VLDSAIRCVRASTKPLLRVAYPHLTTPPWTQASLSGCQERLEDLAQGLQDFLTKEFSESVAPRLRDLAVTLDNLNGYLKEVDEKSGENWKHLFPP
jgi:hypothetical protein